MNTKLMDKLFSEDTPQEFKDKVADKIDEAKENGSSELIEDGENLQFADAGDTVVIEDQNNDEVTEVTEDDDELKLEAVTIPEDPEEVKSDKEEFEEGFEEGKEYEEGKEAEKVDESEDEDQPEESEKSESRKRFSQTQPDVKIEKVEGKDGDHIENSVPEVTLDVAVGIDDKEKAGLKHFSVTIKGGSPEYVHAISKIFSDAAEEAEELDEAEEDLDEINEDADTLAHNANELAEAVSDLEESRDPELAKAVKDMSEEIEAQCDEVDDIDTEDIKAQCRSYSELADDILNADKVKEDPEEVEDKPEDKVEEVEEEKDEAEVESARSFSACLGNFDDGSLAPTVNIDESKLFSIPEDNSNKSEGIQFLDTQFN